MVSNTDAPTKDPQAVALGLSGGRTKRIEAVERRVAALLAEAPNLNAAQVERIGRLLHNAHAAITRTDNTHAGAA